MSRQHHAILQMRLFAQAVPLKPRRCDLAAMRLTGGRVELSKSALVFPTRRADIHALGGERRRLLLKSGPGQRP